MAKHRDTFVGTLRSASQQIEAGEILSGTLIAAILKRLTELEVAEGGPYALDRRTPDFNTNLTISRFLSANGIRLPKLDAYLNSATIISKKNREANEAAKRTNKWEGKSSAIISSSEARMIDQIRGQATERFSGLTEALRESASELIERTIAGNNDRQMTLMAYFVREALGARERCFDDETIAQLGVANVFFWSAFIVYDDFWDEDEAAEPRLLPVANLFARYYVDLLSSRFSKSIGFRTYFHELMDKLDGANAWELTHCRLKRRGPHVFLPAQTPDYGDYSIKFYPAAGHILGPLALFTELGSGPGSMDFEHLTTYFKHYLIAMQINDDSHDWKEDLRRGHISTAVARLIELWRIEHPEADSIHIEADMPELEQLFWFHALEPLCESVLAHAKRSREALASISLIENRAPLEEFILRSERAALRALEDNRTSRELLDAFA